MNVIVLGPNYDNYISASYQRDFLEELKKQTHNYFHYSVNNEIYTHIIEKKAGFTPDFIIYNHGWFNDDIKAKDLEYANIKGEWKNKNLKHILILNKEYANFDKKKFEINKFGFDFIFSHLHTIQEDLGKGNNLVFFPLALKKKRLKKNLSKDIEYRKYDLFFSGILRNWNFTASQGDLRIRIQNELFFTLFDIPIIKKFKYKGLKIYWKPFYKSKIKNKISQFLHGPRLNDLDYSKKLEDSKCVLHTSSPMGIISTRIFEALGAGALGVFSEDSNAKVIFNNMEHYIEFNDINKFIDTVYKIKDKSNKKYFQKIANNGRNKALLENTWESRIESFIKILVT